MLRLLTANANKKAEFKRLFGTYPMVIKDPDNEREVMGTIDETIIYKSLDAGDNTIVEDTTAILLDKDDKLIGQPFEDIKGKLMLEIKYTFNELKTGDKIKSISSLAINRNGKIMVFRGTMGGIIDRSLGNDGLESFMIPVLGDNVLNGTMAELTNRGFRDMISWRAAAVRRFKRYEEREKAKFTPYMYKSCEPDFIIDIKSISPWEGEYQRD